MARQPPEPPRRIRSQRRPRCRRDQPRRLSQIRYPRRSQCPRDLAQSEPEQLLPAFTIPHLPQRIDLDDGIREAFLADATDLFERIEPLVLGLGRDTDPSESLRELGRCFHTLKGAAGSVGLADLASLVHTLEEHLEAPNSSAPANLIDVLHQTLGYLDGLIGLLRTRPIRAGGDDPSGRSSGHAGFEASTQTSSREDFPASQHEPAQTVGSERLSPILQVPSSEVSGDGSSSAGDGPIRVPASRFDELMDLVSELIASRRLWTAQAGSLKSISSIVRNCRNRMLGMPGQAS